MGLPLVVFEKKSNPKTLGYILILSSAVLFALVHVIGKPLLGQSGEGFEINPIALAATIYIINGLFFTPFARKTSAIRSLGNKNLILIGIIAIAEVSALISYFFGLKEATAINASIFSNGEIIFSLLIAITIFRERLNRKELTPCFMIIFGMMILPVGYDLYNNGMALSDLVFGDMLIILSGLLYAIDVNICKYVSDRVSSKRIAQLVSFMAGGFAVGLLFAFQIPYDIALEQLAPISLMAILGIGLATLFFLISLRLIGAVRTILIYSTTSIFGVIFSALFLAEQITLVNVVSIVIVMVGIYLLRNRLGKENENHKNELSENRIPETSSNYHIRRKELPVISIHKFKESRISDRFSSMLKSKVLVRFTYIYEGG